MKYTNFFIMKNLLNFFIVNISLWSFILIIIFLIFFLQQNIFLAYLPVFADIGNNWQVGFQDPATPVMIGIIDLHHTIMFYLTFVFCFFFYLLVTTLYKFNWLTTKYPVSKNVTECSWLEMIWTFYPVIIIWLIAVPSISLIYSTESCENIDLTIKAIGHQWYWSYEYPSNFIKNDQLNENILNIDYNVDAYLNPEINSTSFRILSTTNDIIILKNTNVCLIVTSADVIHSWAIPSFGVKIDAVPGRINAVTFKVLREGYFYGQCSELCGVGHGFMPISVQVLDIEWYDTWNKINEK